MLDLKQGVVYFLCIKTARLNATAGQGQYNLMTPFLL